MNLITLFIAIPTTIACKLATGRKPFQGIDASKHPWIIANTTSTPPLKASVSTMTVSSSIPVSNPSKLPKAIAASQASASSTEPVLRTTSRGTAIPPSTSPPTPPTDSSLERPGGTDTLATRWGFEDSASWTYTSSGALIASIPIWEIAYLLDLCKMDPRMVGEDPDATTRYDYVAAVCNVAGDVANLYGSLPCWDPSSWYDTYNKPNGMYKWTQNAENVSKISVHLRVNY